jgi:hypothetical protein
LRGFKLFSQPRPLLLSRLFLHGAFGDAVTPGQFTQRAFASEIIRFATQPDFVCDAHKTNSVMETNTGQKTFLRFLPLGLLRFLKSSFSPIKLLLLLVETISFPVSFPLVSSFHA